MGVPQPKGHSKVCVNGVFSETILNKQSVAALKKAGFWLQLGNVASRLFCGAVLLFALRLPIPTLIAYRNTPLDGGAYGFESGNGQHRKKTK